MWPSKFLPEWDSNQKRRKKKPWLEHFIIRPMSFFCVLLPSSFGILMENEFKVHYFPKASECLTCKGKKNSGCIRKKPKKTKKKSLVVSYCRQHSTADSLLWPKVIYSVQTRENEISHGIGDMFMHEYVTLIRTLEPGRGREREKREREKRWKVLNKGRQLNWEPTQGPWGCEVTPLECFGQNC